MNSRLPTLGSDGRSEKTVYEIFKTTNPEHPAVAAHLKAIAGVGTQVRLEGEFAGLFLRVVPLFDEPDEIMGCISILNSVGE